MRSFLFSLLGSIAFAMAVVGCRGQTTDQSPIHLTPNMDSQPRYDPQSESKFYEDRRSMRQPVKGTVAQGNFFENDAYATGKDGDHFIAKLPIPITEAVLTRGQREYNIFCTPCHDAMGSGKGLVVTRGQFPAATNLLEEYSRVMPDGQLYEAIAHGARNMPSYGAQIPIDDRWAIVAYVRALQFSQNATVQDIPADKRGGMPVEAAQ